MRLEGREGRREGKREGGRERGKEGDDVLCRLFLPRVAEVV